MGCRDSWGEHRSPDPWYYKIGFYRVSSTGCYGQYFCRNCRQVFMVGHTTDKEEPGGKFMLAHSEVCNESQSQPG